MTVFGTGRLAALLTTAMLIGTAPAMAKGGKGPTLSPTLYSENAVAVVPDNFAGAVCNRYTVGGKQVRKRWPKPAGGTVKGTGGAKARYSMAPSTSALNFSAANPPVQIAIVSGKKGQVKATTVFYYLGNGVTQDAGLTVRNPQNKNQRLPIVDFSLCSRVTNTAGVGPSFDGGPTFDEQVPRCGTQGTPQSPRGCPAGPGFATSKEIVLIDFKPLRERINGQLVPAAFTDDDGALDPRSCFCTGGDPSVTNLTALFQCDDSLPAANGNNPSSFDTPTAAGGACTVNPAPGTKVELIGEQSNDPYFCRTVNGTRRCWRY